MKTVHDRISPKHQKCCNPFYAMTIRTLTLQALSCRISIYCQNQIAFTSSPQMLCNLQAAAFGILFVTKIHDFLQMDSKRTLSFSFWIQNLNRSHPQMSIRELVSNLPKICQQLIIKLYFLMC